jgi:hypothetical protein
MTPVITEGLEGIECKNQLSIGLQIAYRTLEKGIAKNIDSEKIRIDFIENESKDLIIDICHKNHLLFNEAKVWNFQIEK